MNINRESIIYKRRIIQNAALSIALLFHVCGAFGILFSAHKNWFIENTPVNLLVMAMLIFITHPKKNKSFLLFFALACIIGFTADVIGANTHVFFGAYSYGNTLGYKIYNVPLLISINWFIVIYGAGMVTQSYESYMLKRLKEKGVVIQKKMRILSFIIDASFLSFLFDWVMEPVAVKLGFWQWENGSIPESNYFSWIIVSAILLALFRKLNFNRQNIFAVHLFIIQFLFFLVLRTFL